jgi:hypothetical protein
MKDQNTDEKKIPQNASRASGKNGNPAKAVMILFMGALREWLTH